jgi:CO/xanthine dehydrogenase FAD-binding subunit
MRPSRFEYEAPISTAEATELLADAGSASIVIAGGQTLVPQLIRREVEPGRLVDVNRIDELRGVAAGADGTARLGALARHAEIERNRELRVAWPLLPAACSYMSNPVVRRRGTAGGSVAWRSGRSELAAALLAYDASLVASSSASGRRRVRVADSLADPSGRVRADELIVELHLERPAATRRSWGIAEFSVRRWDPALGGAVCVMDGRPGAGAAGDVRVVAFGALERPHRLAAVEALVAEGAGADTIRAEAAREAAALVDAAAAPAADHVAAVVADSAVRAAEQARRAWTRADVV